MRFEVLILLINFFLYFIAYKKNKGQSLFNVGSITFLLYSGLSLMSLVMVLMTTEHSIKINVLALIYLFLCILITYSPLKKINGVEFAVIPPNSRPLNFILILIVFFSVVRFPNIISNFSDILKGFILDSSVFYDQYNTAMETYTQVQSQTSYNYLIIISGLFDRYIPFFLIYYLTLSYRKTWIVLGLIIGLVIAPMHGLIEAQRGILVDILLSCILAYAMFKNSLDSHVKRNVQIIGLTFLIGVFVALSLITFSRFNQDFMDSNNIQRSVVSYTGQAIANFGEFGFDTGGIRYGDRTIPLLKKMFFMDGAYDYAHRMAKYTNLKLNEGMFSTFIGDFVVDFGPVITFVIVILIALGFGHLISYKGKEIPFYKMIAAYMLGYIILCGWHLYPFSDFGGNLSLIMGFILYVFFKNNRNNSPEISKS